MTTRHLLHPEMAMLPEFLPNRDFTPELLRETRASPTVLPDPPATTLRLEMRAAPGRDGAPDVPLYLYTPAESGIGLRPAVLHIHGGGMVLGSAELSKWTLVPMLEAVGAIGVSVEYRLAPETVFPGSQEDCYAALDWLFAHAAELSVDPNRIVLMGESAGGCLAATLALMTRDRGEYRLAGQILTYPMLDHRTGGPDDVWRNPTAGEFVWTRASNQFGWTAMRGDYAADDARRGWFSPALTVDLAGLPPTYMVVGGLDLFIDENLDFARRLTAAGVPVDLDLHAGLPHGFDLMAEAAITKRVRANLLAALRRMVE